MNQSLPSNRVESDERFKASVIWEMYPWRDGTEEDRQERERILGLVPLKDPTDANRTAFLKETRSVADLYLGWLQQKERLSGRRVIGDEEQPGRVDTLLRALTEAKDVLESFGLEEFDCLRAIEAKHQENNRDVLPWVVRHDSRGPEVAAHLSQLLAFYSAVLMLKDLHGWTDEAVAAGFEETSKPSKEKRAVMMLAWIWYRYCEKEPKRNYAPVKDKERSRFLSYCRSVLTPARSYRDLEEQSLSYIVRKVCKAKEYFE